MSSFSSHLIFLVFFLHTGEVVGKCFHGSSGVALSLIPCSESPHHPEYLMAGSMADLRQIITPPMVVIRLSMFAFHPSYLHLLISFLPLPSGCLFGVNSVNLISYLPASPPSFTQDPSHTHLHSHAPRCSPCLSGCLLAVPSDHPQFTSQKSEVRLIYLTFTLKTKDS